MGKLATYVLLHCFAVASSFAFYGCSAVYQQALAVMREPGEHIKTVPDEVWNEYRCAERERPFLRIESMEVVPEMIKPGGRLNYRVVYAMCPAKPSEVLKARAFRRIYFKGEQVASNVNDSLELKPGRWVIDSFFTLPADSPLGVYALEVTFERSERHGQKQVRSFVVSNDYFVGQ
jgi:hypothetical protein